MKIKKISRYVIYLISLFLISLGAAVSVEADLGASPIICLPYVSSLILNISVGTVCLILNVFFYCYSDNPSSKWFWKKSKSANNCRSNLLSFHWFFIDDCKFLNPTNYFSKFGTLLLSCFVVALGILLEVQTEVVYLRWDYSSYFKSFKERVS